MSALGQKRTLRRTKSCPLWVKSGHCGAQSHVRFAPDSDRESGLAQTVMSALLPKADTCGATRDVRFGPKADIGLIR
jgi:hypothetical protein